MLGNDKQVNKNYVTEHRMCSIIYSHFMKNFKNVKVAEGMLKK